MAEACAAVSIKQLVGFDAHRQPYTRLLLQHAIPLAIIAEVLGHSDARSHFLETNRPKNADRPAHPLEMLDFSGVLDSIEFIVRGP